MSKKKRKKTLTSTPFPSTIKKTLKKNQVAPFPPKQLLKKKVKTTPLAPSIVKNNLQKLQAIKIIIKK